MVFTCVTVCKTVMRAHGSQTFRYRPQYHHQWPWVLCSATLLAEKPLNSKYGCIRDVARVGVSVADCCWMCVLSLFVAVGAWPKGETAAPVASSYYRIDSRRVPGLENSKCGKAWVRFLLSVDAQVSQGCSQQPYTQVQRKSIIPILFSGRKPCGILRGSLATRSGFAKK